MRKTYYLAHHGIKGQRWGVRRFQNEDGTLTEEGKRRYGTFENMERVRSRNRKVAIGATAAVATAATVYAVKKHNRNKADLASARNTIDSLTADNDVAKKTIDSLKSDNKISNDLINHFNKKLNKSDDIIEANKQRNDLLESHLKKMKPIVDRYEKQVAVKKANLEIARKAKKDYNTIGYSELTNKFKIPKGSNVHIKNLNHEGGAMIAASLFNVEGGLVKVATGKGG